MTASAAVTWAIVLVAVAGLAVWLVAIALAQRKPFFRHPHAERRRGRVQGATHVGGGRAAALPQRHAAGQPFARHPGREHRELVQELLHAVGLQQRVLQPYELRCMTLILHVALLPAARR